MEERITELEIKIAYQDDTIQQLNEVIIRQQKEIDQLKQFCRQLDDRLSGMTSTAERRPEDEVPPHY